MLGGQNWGSRGVDTQPSPKWIVVSLAVDPERKWVKLDQLLVFPTDKDADPNAPVKTNQDQVDSFV